MKFSLQMVAAAGILALVTACVTQPKVVVEPEKVPETQAPAAPLETAPEAPSVAPLAEFNPATVSEEVKNATFVDAKVIVEKLNAIIQAQNLDAWLEYLTDDYKRYYSDPEVLAKLSESAVLKRLGVKLQTIKDYFLYVVYPSRQNARLDDIEFLGADRIVALTVNQKGERLVLYYLEKKKDTWKIGIGR